MYEKRNNLYLALISIITHTAENPERFTRINQLESAYKGSSKPERTHTNNKEDTKKREGRERDTIQLHDQYIRRYIKYKNT